MHKQVKRIQSTLPPLLLSLILLLIPTACLEFCEDSNQGAIVLGFANAETGEELQMQAVSIYSPQADNTLLYPSELTPGGVYKQIMLPVNPNDSTMTFVFSAQNNTVIDTLQLWYKPKFAFISAECGCATLGTIDSLRITGTKTILPKFEIKDRNIHTVSYRQGVLNAENLRILY